MLPATKQKRMNRYQAEKFKQSYESFLSFWIEQNEHLLPEELSTFDLVELGIFTSHPCVKNANSKGVGPVYSKDGKHCVYQREHVLEWLKGRALNVWKNHDQKERTSRA